MPYTLAEAAVACGLDKSTVRRAVRGGRISGTRDDLGVWYVEPAELHRVFPPAARTDDTTTAVPLHAPLDAATDTLVAELRDQLAEMRAQRDAWQGVAERLSLSPPKPEPPKPMTWWPWRRSTG